MARLRTNFLRLRHWLKWALLVAAILVAGVWAGGGWTTFSWTVKRSSPQFWDGGGLVVRGWRG